MTPHKTLAPLLAVTIPIVATCDWLEMNVRESFGSSSEAAASVTTGRYDWKLSCLPQGATNIDSLLNLDTGELLPTYRCPPTDLSTFLQRCRPLSSAEIHYPRNRLSRTLDWWPEVLSGERATAGDAAVTAAWACVRELRLQSGEVIPVTAFLVVTPDGRVFYWEL